MGLSKFLTAVATRLRVHAGGDGATPVKALEVVEDNTEGAATVAAAVIGYFQNNATAATDLMLALLSGTTGKAGLHFGDKDGQDGKFYFDNNTGSMFVETAAGVVVEITSAGAVKIGGGSGSTGITLNSDGTVAVDGEAEFLGGVEADVIQSLAGNILFEKASIDTYIFSPSGATSRVSLAASGNMGFYIDSDNSQTDRVFAWGHNGDQKSGGSTTLMTLIETGLLRVYNDLQVDDDAVISGELTLNGAYVKLPVKSTTGDPATPADGWMYVNTFDNKVRVYADGAWRDLATW